MAVVAAAVEETIASLRMNEGRDQIRDWLHNILSLFYKKKKHISGQSENLRFIQIALFTESGSLLEKSVRCKLEGDSKTW